MHTDDASTQTLTSVVELEPVGADSEQWRRENAMDGIPQQLQLTHGSATSRGSYARIWCISGGR